MLVCTHNINHYKDNTPRVNVLILFDGPPLGTPNN
jgi:hypothetical protein